MSKWFNELITFNKDELIKQENEPDTKLDEDYLLIPHIIEKTILVKLIPFAESVYDPMSTRQTKFFAQLFSQLIRDYPTLSHQSSNTKVNLRNFLKTFFRKFRQPKLT